MHSRQQLAADFRRLGVKAGDTIMLHASIRSVGPIAGGPDQIHLALKDALTETGTLMMYASCPEHYDEIGRGNLTPGEERELLETLPPFDPYTARSSRDNGALVELLRTYPGSTVNPHVARFVVWGRRAAELIATQPWDYAFGHDSALERFVNADGRILLLGSDHDAVTFLHYPEHIADIPNKRIARFRVPIDADGHGTRVWRDMAEVDTADAGAHPNWPARFFARIVDTYLHQTHNRGNLVGHSTSFLFDARGLLDFSRRIMQTMAADPVAAAALLD
jgi:aminoglycoside 3-N-acetyltransferase